MRLQSSFNNLNLSLIR